MNRSTRIRLQGLTIVVTFLLCGTALAVVLNNILFKGIDDLVRLFAIMGVVFPLVNGGSTLAECWMRRELRKIRKSTWS